MTVRSYHYLLQPTARQVRALDDLLHHQREIYNAALEERIGAWKWEKRSVSFFDQCRTLTELREARPDSLACGVVVCRGTLKRLDRAFVAFFRRCKAGETPGFPRFKNRTRWDSVQWEYPNGWQLKEDERRLRLLGVGEVKVRLHRPLRGTPKAITVRREGRRWFVTVCCVDVPTEPLPATGKQTGFDLGVTNLLASSEGELFENPRHTRREADRLAAAQRDLARKRRGSHRRHKTRERVALAHRRAANRRKDANHKLSRRLVDENDLLVFEKLRIPNMTRSASGTVDNPGTNVAQKAGLNREILSAGWGQLLADGRVQGGRCRSRASAGGAEGNVAAMRRVRPHGAGEPRGREVRLPGLRSRRSRGRQRGCQHSSGRPGPARSQRRAPGGLGARPREKEHALTSITDDLDGFASEVEPEAIPLSGAAALDQADRYLRAMRRIDRDRAELEEHARAEHARIDEWLRDRTAGMQERRSHLEKMLDSFTRAWKGRTGHAPPKLINGTLRLTAPRTRVEIEDADAFKDWAEGNERLDLLRIRVEPDKARIAQATSEGPVASENDEERRSPAIGVGGEIVPGVSLVTPKADSFTVTVST